MYQLLYRSTADAGLPSQDVFKIVETSARNNPARYVTGFLVFAHNQFAQFVEGPKEQLDALLKDLSSDPRHCDIEILAERVAGGRCFPKWRMRRIAVDRATIADLVAEMRAASVSEDIVRKVREFVNALRLPAA